MNRNLILAVVVSQGLFAFSQLQAEAPTTRTAQKVRQPASADWPSWRGPNGDGHASPDQKAPVKWDEKTNIAWKKAIPGKGHGSPIVVGEHVYLATSVDEKETRSLLCLNRKTGEIEWETVVHQGHAVLPRNKKGTQASSTPACDGERLFINFLNDDAMYTSALSLEGEILWQRKISDYVVHQGFGSSPVIHEQLVIVVADNKSGGAIAGLNRETGEVVWKRDRPETPNYPSPVIMETSGKVQLIMIGCDLVTSLDPLTGKENWEIEGATTECVTSTVTNGDLIYTTGGYPKNHVAAVRTDGSGKTEWENGVRVYVPSLLIKDGYLYGVTDAGVAMCWNAATGKEVWKGRLGGTFSSSPVLVGNLIYVSNEASESFIFEASPDEFTLVSKNNLENVCFSTPAICGGQIFIRVAQQTGEARQEYVYCIAETPSQSDN
ncbi:outer membrane protein assembly factor BamB family protein [Thalassoglobus polymorphus]|uniref:Outer membrane biogenesis protein BamB n=1 Tax=Thalassoglobus polymorphus TaxID=2527994 RepID=A0A517QGV7_9PLAN|nr:PQQ-binding-like beta-propeller repeat protein [Thalassoglobus polymorphus]QDT30864.1 outer membrane biogenesis protein BamB [Thalassoglobus polymorphus]